LEGNKPKSNQLIRTLMKLLIRQLKTQRLIKSHHAILRETKIYNSLQRKKSCPNN
jgi:hypothetical protein